MKYVNGTNVQYFFQKVVTVNTEDIRYFTVNIVNFLSIYYHFPFEDISENPHIYSIYSYWDSTVIFVFNNIYVPSC